MSWLGDWRARRQARYQRDILEAQAAARKAEAEAAAHARRTELARLPNKSAADLMEQRILEAGSQSLLMGWADSTGAFRDVLRQLFDFSRGGIGTGAGITSKTGRRGSDYPFITSEGHLATHRDFSRLVAPNPNIQGLLGGRRRYTIGTGVTIRAVPKGSMGKDAAAQAQKVLDDFGKANRFAFRLRSFYDRSSVDGEGIWRLFPADDGTTTIRTVYSEQLRCPPDDDPAVYEYGIKTPEDDSETVEEYAVFPLSNPSLEPDRVPPEEVIFFGPNRQDGVKRSLPDWTLTTGEICELADELGNNLGSGSVNQAAIAYIRQHTGVPASSVRDFATGDASYTKTDPYTGNEVPVKRIAAGTIIDTNENTEFMGSPFNMGIEAHASIFQLLMNRVSSRWNAPKWLATSNNDEVNFASSLTAESPFVIAIQESQQYLAEPITQLHERVLANAAAAGALPPNVLDLVEVKVTFPSPVARDRNKEAEARSLELKDGYLSPQQAAEQAGYEWEKVVKEIKAAKAQGWTGGQPQPGLPGQAGAPGANGKPSSNGNGKPPQTTYDHTGQRRGLGEALTEVWHEDDHPRGDDGKFIAGEDMVAAKKDPDKAAELRKRVTDPKEREKLDAAIGKPKEQDQPPPADDDVGEPKPVKPHELKLPGENYGNGVIEYAGEYFADPKNLDGAAEMAASLRKAAGSIGKGKKAKAEAEHAMAAAGRLEKQIEQLRRGETPQEHQDAHDEYADQQARNAETEAASKAIRARIIADNTKAFAHLKKFVEDEGYFPMPGTMTKAPMKLRGKPEDLMKMGSDGTIFVWSGGRINDKSDPRYWVAMTGPGIGHALGSTGRPIEAHAPADQEARA